MIFRFAWRYFRAEKSANAINIIAWVTTAVIAFATCCQVLVLSVFNGFEGLVKSLYSSFYTDIKVLPASGKTFILSPQNIAEIKSLNAVAGVSMTAEDKALLQNAESQTVITLKGVDSNYKFVSGVSGKITAGEYFIGNADNPALVMGYGVQHAADVVLSDALPPSDVTLILPRKTAGNDAAEAMSEGFIKPAGVFSIQQDIDNQYAITSLDFVKQQMAYQPDEFSGMEVRLQKNADVTDAVKLIRQKLGNNFNVLTRYEQNAGLYSTMNTEKWAIYAVFTLILIIAAFTMVSALTILVLEKKKDIAILRSMGATKATIQKIFLAEGLLLGLTGSFCGTGIALIICLLQMKFHFIKINGGSFLIDYFPVRLLAGDFVTVTITALLISFLASWFPARKAAGKNIELK